MSESKSSTFKIVRKDQIKAFLSVDPVILLESKPVLPAKFLINTETDGILFELIMNNSSVMTNASNSSALFFLDCTLNCIFFVDPVYFAFIKQKLSSTETQIEQANTSTNKPVHNKWLDKSFSLSGKLFMRFKLISCF